MEKKPRSLNRKATTMATTRNNKVRVSGIANKKRKRTVDALPESVPKTGKPKHLDQVDGIKPQSREDEILCLEYEVTQSRKHFNNIAKLITIATSLEESPGSSGTAIIALCRTFCRLFAAGNFQKSRGAPESEILVLKWLEGRYNEYAGLLLGQIRLGSTNAQISAISVLMRLVKHEVNAQGDALWAKGLFYRVLGCFISSAAESEVSMNEFVQKYFLKYDDVRYFTIALLP
jgi:U3 small nucleolar RNA-associated protein 19